MKTTLFILAILGISCGTLAVPATQRALADDLQDFLNIIPTDKILDIIINNLNDPELQAVIEYLFSDDFKNLVLEVEAIPEFKIVVKYLTDAGLPVNEWLAALHELIGLPPPKPFGIRSAKGLANIIDQIKNTLPLKEIKALFDEKMQKSPAFKELIEKLSSPTFQDLVKALRANDKVKTLLARLLAVGVDVVKIIQTIKDFFGLK